MLRLKEKYTKEIVPAMMAKFGYKSVMAVPKVSKVVVNCGFGRQIVAKTGEDSKRFLEAILEDLNAICGQKPSLRKAKKSIASFKLRQGVPIGVCVTLRGQRMYDFIERVTDIALPRTRDFRGISVNSFDNKGNLTIGIREQIVFPEISQEKVKMIFGFEITVATTSRNKAEGAALLKLMGFPIKEKE